MKAYKLNVENIKTIEDVAIILDGLGLVIRDDAPMYDSLSKYFSDEVEPPAQIATEVEAGEAQEEG